MKRTTAILLAAILAASLLTACGSSSDSYFGASESVNMSMSIAPQAAPMPSASSGAAYDFAEPEVLYAAMSEGGTGAAPQMQGEMFDEDSSSDPYGTLPDAGSGGLAEKIIYTAYADIETVDFDETIEMVNELISFNNAFIETSYQGGRNLTQSHYGYQTYRTANFTLRVPKERFRAVTDDLDILGNVTSLSTNAENISSQFRDVESRLSSYRIQEERLLAMLEKSDTVADMITIESRLADVRYSIESFTSTLNNWQNQVDYSTLTLFIREVEKLSETVPIQQTYWQQVGSGLQSTTRGVGEFFTEIFKWLIVNLPVFAILAIIAIVIVIVVKKKIKKRRMLYNYGNNINNNYQGNTANPAITDNSAENDE